MNVSWNSGVRVPTAKQKPPPVRAIDDPVSVQLRAPQPCSPVEPHWTVKSVELRRAQIAQICFHWRMGSESGTAAEEADDGAELPPLPQDEVPSPEQVRSGPEISPSQRITLYSASEWEAFVVEWAHTLVAQYARVRRLGGSGDQGRDVVGYLTMEIDSIRDIYQCKHYATPLTPSDIWVELGKVCWYTFGGAYRIPRRYLFVSPRGTGTSLVNLLEEPDELRRRLISEWPDKCAEKIAKNETITLDGPLKSYVEAFDFSIFGDVSPSDLIQQHQRSPRHISRFGGGLPFLNSPPVLPAEIAANETTYVAALLEAYSEHTCTDLGDVTGIPVGHVCASHLQNSREAFYDAEMLRAMSREQLGTAAYPALLENVLDGIRDIVDSSHDDGFARVKAASQATLSMQLSADPHVTRLTPRRRKGTCHQLANDRRVRWRNP